MAAGAGALLVPRRRARSVREPPSEVLISDPKVNQPKQARRPRMRIQRAHDRALAIARPPRLQKEKEAAAEQARLEAARQQKKKEEAEAASLISTWMVFLNFEL